MIKILALDYETEWATPVNPLLIRPLEVGAVLTKQTLEGLEVIEEYNTLIYEKDHMVSPKELVQLTGITDQMRMEEGISSWTAHNNLNDMLKDCDYVMAHNGNQFDKIVYEEECARLGIKHVVRPWIDTKVDLPLPDHIKTRKLTHLWAEHKLEGAHRAIFDVNLMLEIFSHYDLLEVIELSKQPTIKLIASVSYHDRNLAKDRGYYWDGENKRWTKELKEQAAIREQSQAPFPVQMLDDYQAETR